MPTDGAAAPIGILYYFDDPMCSWGWGFQPVLEQVEAEYPELRRVTVLGGLRQGEAEPMSEDLAAMISSVWHRIEAATGQPFEHRFWEVHRPLATTLPACRAVVAARTLDPAREWPYMVAMFRAYYTQARDPSREATHLEIAGELGFDRETFARQLGSQAVDRALEKDLEWTRTLGITGYPTLVLALDETYYLLSPGYQPIERLRRGINTAYERHGIEFTRPESGLWA